MEAAQEQEWEGLEEALRRSQAEIGGPSKLPKAKKARKDAQDPVRIKLASAREERMVAISELRSVQRRRRLILKLEASDQHISRARDVDNHIDFASSHPSSTLCDARAASEAFVNSRSRL